MKKVTWFLFIILILVLAACSLDPKARIETGNHTVTTDLGAANKIGRENIQMMSINQETQEIIFSMKDGTKITVPFSTRDQSEWPSGCPTNIYSTTMEVFDLDVAELEIGTLIISNPILVRNCPEDPYKIILREDGEIGGAGTGCLNYEVCIYFENK